MWHSTLDNRKVQSLPDHLFKVWCNLMMLAAKIDQDGALPNCEDIAFALRIAQEKCAEHIEQLVAMKFIDRLKSGLRIHDWEDWQLKSYSSTKRVQAFRERQRITEETDGNVSCNVPETLPQQTALAREGELEEKRIEKKTPLTPRAPRRGAVLVDFVLPSWIPENDWNDWLAMRKAKRAPTTIGAMNRAVKNLERLKAEGHAPADVLQQSTLNAWTDVYPIKVPYTNGKPQGSSTPYPNGAVSSRPKEKTMKDMTSEELEELDAYRRKRLGL
jgi:hypothetical protein